MTESHKEFAARKKRERQEYLEREAFIAENQPRDAEELRTAEAEDKNLQGNMSAIMGKVYGMDADEFDRYLRRHTKEVKKAGGKTAVTKAYKEKRKGSSCAVVALALLGGLGSLAWGAVELVAGIVS